MTLSFASATGNLFNRLAKLGALVDNLRDYQDLQFIAMTSVSTGVVGQFNTESDIQAVMGASYIGLLNGSGAGIGGVAQSIAQLTLNRMIFRDTPQLNQTLSQSNIIVSIEELIRQMKSQVASVLAITVTATPNAFAGVGNGVVNVSTKRPFDGRTLENAYSENVRITCTSDSYVDGSLAGNESMFINGVGSEGDVFAFNWPLGSNATITVASIDGNEDNGSGNLLTNSGFENWTGSSPDNWVVVTGSSLISQEPAFIYDGTYALEVAGNGSTQLSMTQQFDDSTGSSSTLSPTTQYSVNLFMRRDGTVAANGTLSVELINEDGNIVNDEAGTPNAFTINLTALTVSYQSFTGDFRTPYIMPSSISIRLRTTGTALTSGRSVYIDKVSLGQMSQLYTSGPFFAVHAGSVPFQTGDYANCQVTNGRGSGGTLNTWQTLMARLFPQMIQSELLLPSSSSPTISDGLIA